MSSPSPAPVPASSSAPIPVVVAGALGRMGAEVVKTVTAAADCTLVGAIDTTPGKEGADVGLELGLGELEVAITADLEGCLCAASQGARQGQPAVLVDFTHPKVVYEHTRAAIAYGVHPVIGTTGGAIPDTVPSEAGILVPPDDAMALAEALRAAGRPVHVIGDAAALDFIEGATNGAITVARAIG